MTARNENENENEGQGQSQCPSREDLEQYARAGEAAEVARHLVSCSACRSAMETIRRDAVILRELRRAASDDSTSPDERARLRQICRQARDQMDADAEEHG